MRPLKFKAFMKCNMNDRQTLLRRKHLTFYSSLGSTSLRLALLALACQQVLGFEVEDVSIALSLARVAVARSLRLLCNLAHLLQHLRRDENKKYSQNHTFKTSNS